MRREPNIALWIVVISGGIFVLVIICMIGLPLYGVWQQELSGKASLAKAGQERQILVEQAKAEMDAAEHTAKAISILGEAAKKYPEYRQQIFMSAYAEALQNESIDQIIYVPTEAGIPILEAGKLSR